MIRFKVTVYHRGIMVKVLAQNDKQLLTSYCESLISYEKRYVRGRGNVRVRKDTYATYHHRTCTYGIHRGYLDGILEHLVQRGVSSSEILISMQQQQPGANADIVLKDTVVARDYQVPVIEFSTDKNRRVVVLPIQTGRGKTMMTIAAMAKLKVRTVIGCGAQHIPTWMKEFNNLLDIDSERILVVKGNKALKQVIAEAKDGIFNYDILLMSTNTTRDYLTEYEVLGRSSYGCTPIELYNLLGVGLRVVDEAHQCLHFQYRLDIETDVNRVIYLSATISSHDPFINKLYDNIFPIQQRYSKLDYVKYINVTALAYSVSDSKNIKCTGGTGHYSNNTFEAWIIKRKDILKNYIDMILYIMGKSWVSNRLDGDKMLIFNSSVDMCVLIAQKINTKYPQFSCSSYTSEQVEEVLHTHDIIVTTPGSTGTGKDIKGLTVTICAMAVNSKEQNIQMLGRLREIPDGRLPDYYYLVCTSIPKQLQYHKNKLTVYRGLVKTHRAINTRIVI